MLIELENIMNREFIKQSLSDKSLTIFEEVEYLDALNMWSWQLEKRGNLIFYITLTYVEETNSLDIIFHSDTKLLDDYIGLSDFLGKFQDTLINHKSLRLHFVTSDISINIKNAEEFK